MSARTKPEREAPKQLTLEARLAMFPPTAPAPTTPTVAVTLTVPVPVVPVPVAVAAPAPSPDAISEAPPPALVPAAPRIFVVSELVRAARLMLEARFSDVRVEGEISGLKRSGPGHIYFCLKDEEAQLDCVMFSREAGRLRFRPEEGMAVRVRGRLTIYEGRGKFQMSVTDIEPTGAGALAVAFEQLKKKLAAEGLFDAARKRPLPFLPRRLGVVTSSSGAVLRDIIRVAHRRFPVSILLAPTPVQGDGAALSIASALRRLQDVPDVDVIIVARGGGSLEDLWAFNEEPVARAIVACKVPVISAVGHETDFTIADFVADVRAPTPSAAAALAVPVADDLRAELILLSRRGARGVQANLHQGRLIMERARARLGDPRRLLGSRRQAIDELVERSHRAWRRRMVGDRTALRTVELALYRSHPQRRIAVQRAALIALNERLQNRMRLERDRRHRALESCHAKLGALSPLRVLERGFSLTVGPDGHLVTNAAQLRPGDAVRVRLNQGELGAEVREVRAADAERKP
ncbi:MAG TPA: exodeoxyribonuclease VII large subunit [Polyangia bacterium]